jgi:hypothetical protein
MPNYPEYSVLESFTPLAIDSTEESLFIKGFASVEVPDRANHFAAATEFNVDTFLVTGTLLRDHKFVRDRNGNEVSAGVVREAEPAYISERREDKWVVKSTRTLEEINTVSTNRFPDLEVGSRGLFVVAEVTEPMTQKEVRDGKLGAFSWRGLAQVVKGQDYDVLKMIDLKEISIVHMPVNPASAYEIGKSEGFQEQEKVPTEIIKFKLSKEAYPDQDTVKAYLKAREIDYLSITENDTDFFAVVQDQAVFDVSKSYLVTVGNVSVVTASRLEKDSLNAELVGDLQDTPVEDIQTVSKNTQADESFRVCFVDEKVIDQYFPNCKKEVVKSEITDDSGETVSQEQVKITLSDEDIQELMNQAKPESEVEADAPAEGTEAEAEAVSEEAPEAPVEEPVADAEASAEESVQIQILRQLQDLTNKLAEGKQEAPQEPAAEQEVSEQDKKALVDALKSEIVKDVVGEVTKALGQHSLPLNSREERVETTKGEASAPTDWDLFNFLVK